MVVRVTAAVMVCSSSILTDTGQHQLFAQRLPGRFSQFLAGSINAAQHVFEHRSEHGFQTMDFVPSDSICTISKRNSYAFVSQKATEAILVDRQEEGARSRAAGPDCLATSQNGIHSGDVGLLTDLVEQSSMCPRLLAVLF